MYCWVNLELFDASSVASTCSLRNPSVLSGEHILRQFPGTHLAGTGTKPGKNESSRFRSYCGVMGVSVLTRDHDDLFADIMTVERTMFSPFLASSRQVFGESLPLPIVYIAAALVVVCWVPSSNGFPLCPTAPHPPKRKRFASLAPRPRTTRSRHTLGAVLLRRHWDRANPWGFLLGSGRNFLEHTLHCAQKRGVLWERWLESEKQVLLPSRCTD